MWKTQCYWLALTVILCSAITFAVKIRDVFARHMRDSQNFRSRHCGDGGRILSIEDFGAIPDSDVALKEHDAYSEFFPGDQTPTKEKAYSRLNRRQETFGNNITHLCLRNTAAFNKALRSAHSGDVVLVPDGKTYSFTGGIIGSYLDNVTIDIAGSIHFVHDLQVWPFRSSTERKYSGYRPAINIVDSQRVTLTSSSKNLSKAVVDYHRNEVYLDQHGGFGGTINGNGKVWWDDAIFGRLPGKDGDTRPRLVHVQSSANILVENLTLLNSPFWTLTVEAVGAEIRYINVLVDRKYQSRLFQSSDVIENNDQLAGFPFPDDIPDWVGRRLHQPQDLNTDGIDTRGIDIRVHDCIIQNADDSVAVKPPVDGNETTALNGTIPYTCTRNVTVENVVLTGFGASIGSVGPSANHLCVDGVVFRNVTMPGTGKGIYIKSDHSDCIGGNSSQISNILYEDVLMRSPFWWPIWIGPQQQHQPNSGLHGNCPLLYPIPGSKHCPTQGCATFENITLRNIFIDKPVVSPGVILGNETNSIRNLVFDNVTVTNSKWKPFHGRWPFHQKHYPYQGKYQCIHAVGSCRNCHPTPSCLREL